MKDNYYLTLYNVYTTYNNYYYVNNVRIPTHCNEPYTYLTWINKATLGVYYIFVIIYLNDLQDDNISVRNYADRRSRRLNVIIC